jgi:hypothetical protein
LLRNGLSWAEGWPFAVLVACSVEKGAGQNARGSRLHDRGDEKVSLTTFAELAGTSDNRVLRYLAAWDKAATAGLVLAASELSPTDVGIPLPEAGFGGY